MVNKTFNNDYFEKNAIHLFRLRKALRERNIQNEELDNESVVRKLLREDVGIRNRITSMCCESLKDYLLSQGGVSVYLQQPIFIANVYVALAIYNLRIQDEISRLTTFSNLTNDEAQLLVSDLLGEEEIADETKANKYRNLCYSVRYKRAEYAVEQYVPHVPMEQVFLVKSYLRSYIKTGSPPKTKYSPFQLALLQKNSTHTRPIKRSPCKNERLSTEEIEDEPMEDGLMTVPSPVKAESIMGIQSPIQKVYVKVERLDKEEIRRLSDEKSHRTEPVNDEKSRQQRSFNDSEMQVDESMFEDSIFSSTEKKDIGVQTIVNNKEEVRDNRTILQRNKLNNRKRKLNFNIYHINKQRYILNLKKIEIEQREAALAAREVAVEMRESAVNFREKLLKRSKVSIPESLGSV